MINDLGDTIVAVATPPGEGAIGIVRLSGKQAIEIADQFFYGKNLTRVEGHTIHYGKIKDENDRIIDECLAIVFRSPRSYTNEDIVEFNCHGSSYILEEIVQLFLRHGIRHAKKGEFTLRAFLNGQMDLSQAEAIADLIASNNEATHELAMKQMRGGFSDEIKRLRQELIDFAALIELELDFSEEDVEFADRTKLRALVTELQEAIQKLLNSFRLGNVLKNGVATVIAGRPNAGKSTLLNALLNEERAIVSEIAGTTRDTVEEVMNINGVLFRLIDTAGIRVSEDQIEKMGVSRTMEKIAQSTLVIYVFDVTETTPRDLWEDADRFLDASKAITARSSQIFVANKMDLNPYTHPEDYYRKGSISYDNLVSISAKNKMNIEYLKERLYKAIISSPELLDQTIITNNRHYEALYRADESLGAVVDGLDSGISGDLIALDIRQALHHLGEITGEIYTDDLLDSIFGRFCIGK